MKLKNNYSRAIFYLYLFLYLFTPFLLSPSGCSERENAIGDTYAVVGLIEQVGCLPYLVDESCIGAEIFVRDEYKFDIISVVIDDVELPRSQLDDFDDISTQKYQLKTSLVVLQKLFPPKDSSWDYKNAVIKCRIPNKKESSYAFRFDFSQVKKEIIVKYKVRMSNSDKKSKIHTMTVNFDNPKSQ